MFLFWGGHYSLPTKLQALKFGIYDDTKMPSKNHFQPARCGAKQRIGSRTMPADRVGRRPIRFRTGAKHRIGIADYFRWSTGPKAHSMTGAKHRFGSRTMPADRVGRSCCERRRRRLLRSDERCTTDVPIQPPCAEAMARLKLRRPAGPFGHT